MPYPNEHACRLREPDDFVAGSFRSMERLHRSKPYRVIMGKLKEPGGGRRVEQTYRYPKEAWTEAEARAHCRDHAGRLFEPARETRRV